MIGKSWCASRQLNKLTKMGKCGGYKSLERQSAMMIGNRADQKNKINKCSTRLDDKLPRNGRDHRVSSLKTGFKDEVWIGRRASGYFALMETVAQFEGDEQEGQETDGSGLFAQEPFEIEGQREHPPVEQHSERLLAVFARQTVDSAVPHVTVADGRFRMMVVVAVGISDRVVVLIDRRSTVDQIRDGRIR